MFDGYKQYLTKIINDIYEKYFINVFYNRYSEVKQSDNSIVKDDTVDEESF